MGLKGKFGKMKWDCDERKMISKKGNAKMDMLIITTSSIITSFFQTFIVIQIHRIIIQP
jgi:hypothetical protein